MQLDNKAFCRVLRPRSTPRTTAFATPSLRTAAAVMVGGSKNWWMHDDRFDDSEPKPKFEWPAMSEQQGPKRRPAPKQDATFGLQERPPRGGHDFDRSNRGPGGPGGSRGGRSGPRRQDGAGPRHPRTGNPELDEQLAAAAAAGGPPPLPGPALAPVAAPPLAAPVGPGK